MNFSSLTPLSSVLPAPALTEHTVTVSQRLRVDLMQVMRSFEKSFAAPDPEKIALIVATSGSTGTPKKTLLSSRALTASGRATEELVGAPCAQWLLALPVHYVAGAQVLARSALAGTSPVITDAISAGSSFDAADFLRSCQRLTTNHTMVSLVPAQLTKLLEAADQLPELIDALRSFRGILLGGAPAPTALLQQSAHEELPIFCTYGSAETAGGCIYNGKPLPGVHAAVDNAVGKPGRIWLGGAQIASGYLADTIRTNQHFFIDGKGTFWYCTDDLGVMGDRLTVTGRADDVIISGSVKVSPAPVAATLEKHPAVREAFVCGIEHRVWGSAVAAAVNMVPGTQRLILAQELEPLIAELEPAQRPKRLLFLRDFPTLSTGKPDRARLKQLLSSQQ